MSDIVVAVVVEDPKVTNNFILTYEKLHLTKEIVNSFSVHISSHSFHYFLLQHYSADAIFSMRNNIITALPQKLLYMIQMIRIVKNDDQ